MKRFTLFLIGVLLMVTLTACSGDSALNYYTIIDEMVIEYEEYLSYKKEYQRGVANSSLSKANEEELERKIALEQADALDLVRDIESAYKKLPDKEKGKLLNYIKSEKDDKYSALADWLTDTGVTYQDLIEGIEGEEY